MIKIDVNKIEKWNYIKECHKKYFETYVSDNYKKIQFKNCKEDKGAQEFLQKLFTKNLAIGNRTELKECIILYNKYIEKIKVKASEKTIKKRIKRFNSIVKEVFNYKQFRENKNNIIDKNNNRIGWNRNQLISLLNIRTCPYCNRQYVTNYLESGEINKTTADLDHFYSQDKYPFLALSLYNFIPSCQICNSRFKGNKEGAENGIYPYEEGFEDDAKFIIESDTLNYMWNNSDDFKIKLQVNNYCNDEKKIERINKSIELFKLNKVYDAHKDYCRELINKSIIYNDEMITYLLKQYKDVLDEESIKREIMGNYYNEIDLQNRPLAKLTKDICEELGIEV